VLRRRLGIRGFGKAADTMALRRSGALAGRLIADDFYSDQSSEAREVAYDLKFWSSRNFAKR